MSLLFFICFFSLLLSWYVFLGVGQRGVVVYHGLVWVRAAVVRPVERAAETPALCAPSRRSVSNHGNHFIYQDQSASIQQGPKMIRQNHAMLKNYVSSFTSFETGSKAFAHFALCLTPFASTFLQLPNRNVCTVINSTASTISRWITNIFKVENPTHGSAWSGSSFLLALFLFWVFYLILHSKHCWWMLTQASS